MRHNYRAIDWGLTHPTVCLWAAVYPEKNIVHIYDELCKSGLVVEESCEVIKDKTGDTKIEWTVIDPSAARRDVITGRSVQDEFLRCGIGTVPGDRRGGDKIGGRGVDVVKRFIKKGMLLVDPKCRNLIYELKTLQWGQKEGDDCTDALRYLLVRLHDLVFRGVLNGPVEVEEKRNPLIFNFNDRVLFPKQSFAPSSDVVEQIQAF